MLNSLYKEIPVNSLKKSSSDFCFLNVPEQILLFLVGSWGSEILREFLKFIIYQGFCIKKKFL